MAQIKDTPPTDHLAEALDSFEYDINTLLGKIDVLLAGELLTAEQAAAGAPRLRAFSSALVSALNRLEDRAIRDDPINVEVGPS